MQNNTSISARGVRADTESITIISTAPDLHILSAADEGRKVRKFIIGQYCLRKDQVDIDKQVQMY